MKAYTIIYTKLHPDESPWGKTDFHTMFYPTGFMSKADVQELEKRIHFPGTEIIKEKETVFYLSIQGISHLVILHIHSLPDARDTFGRGGIFLCQGFIFPPQLWKSVPTPRSVFEMVRDRLFSTREEVLSSPLVDRETGDIRPIEIPEERLALHSKELPQIRDNIECRMIILLNRLAHNDGNRPVVFIKGDPGRISHLMDRLIAYVPDELKITLGWDPGFESGNLSFYPLKIVGFKKHRPSVGTAIEIDAETLTIHEFPDTSQFFLPQTPYEKWLQDCHKGLRSKEEIEKSYKLSLFLENEIQINSNEVPSDRSCFVTANQVIIENLFLKRIERLLGEKTAQYVSDSLPPDTKLDLMIENIPHKSLANIVERLILKNRLSPKTARIQIPDIILNVGSDRLKLIKGLWKQGRISNNDLNPLDQNQRLEFIKYLLVTDWGKEDWIIDLLKGDHQIFDNFLSEGETKKLIEDILFGVILKEREYKGIERIILDEVIKQQKEFDLLSKKVETMDLLEGFIKKGTLEEKEMRAILSWAKKRRPPGEGYPYIRAFIYALKQDISDLISKSPEILERLNECLDRYHGWKPEKSKQIGPEKHLEGVALLNDKKIGIYERLKDFLRLRDS